jgi:hypothetical protein
MTATYPQAIDDIFSLFLAAWQLATPDVVESVPEIRWQGAEQAELPDKSAYWCRVSTQTLFEEQSTLNDVAQVGKKRYSNSGLVFVQLFCPMTDSQATEKGRALAVIARDAFRGQATSHGVWFRNARIVELPPEDDTYRFNVIAEYLYDDIG